MSRTRRTRKIRAEIADSRERAPTEFGCCLRDGPPFRLESGPGLEPKRTGGPDDGDQRSPNPPRPRERQALHRTPDRGRQAPVAPQRTPARLGEHGVVLLQEDEAKLAERRRTWGEVLRPTDEVEAFLVERAVVHLVKLERASVVESASHLERRRKLAAKSIQSAETTKCGHRLDAVVSLGKLPNEPNPVEATERLSQSGNLGKLPNEPNRVVTLERSSVLGTLGKLPNEPKDA